MKQRNVFKSGSFIRVYTKDCEGNVHCLCYFSIIMANRIRYNLMCFILLMTGAHGHTAGDFPLNDCDTGQFDILVIETVLVDTGEGGALISQPTLQNIADIWTSDGSKSSRVRVFRVQMSRKVGHYYCRMELVGYEQKSINLCNGTESESFFTSITSSLQDVIELKIEVAARVFSDTSVRRENSTLVAVIVASEHFYPPALTADETTRIPDILQHKRSDIKVLIVINSHVEDIYLRDTILSNGDITTQTAYMALCKKCIPSWPSFAVIETAEFISCYRLDVAHANVDWLEASTKCNKIGVNLATVKSNEELVFLREQLFKYFMKNRDRMNVFINSTSFSTAVYFGLTRDTTNVAKRFQWAHPRGHLPLVINHWLPDNPTGICSENCGAWVYNGILNYTVPDEQVFEHLSYFSSVFSEYINKNSEGWSNVGCGTKLSVLSLCEITLFRHVEDIHSRIGNDNQDIFLETLNRPDFQEFESSIVSVPAYANSKEFVTFLKDKNEDFPLFDCGEDAAQPRYISYSHVCDCSDHCSNRRDESVCLRYNGKTCRSGQCIDSDAVCDMIKDCEDGSDEENCETCIGSRCCDGTCLPPHLFHDGQIDCSECKTLDNDPVNDESGVPVMNLSTNETCAFTCNRKMCVHPSQLNDGHVDCYGIEGPLDETIGRLEQANSCYDKLGRPYWAPKCVFLIDRYGSVLGCRDLSHLQNCSDFPCQEGYHKCPGRYCIPLHYVWDGKGDCPSGEEERHIVNHSCNGTFACWNSKVCLHHGLVCDGHQDCPFKDDELNCDVSCRDGFRCISGTVIVEKHTVAQLESLRFIGRNTRYLDMSGVDLSRVLGNLWDYEFNCPSFYDVRFSRCAIKDGYIGFQMANCMGTALKVDLSYNMLTTFIENKMSVETSIFESLQKLNLSFNIHLNDFSIQGYTLLENLDISHTGLTYLMETCFRGLPSLKYLNLSNTRLSVFHRHIFPASFTLQTLDLRGSPIVKFLENTFNGLIITSSLYTDNFGLCCPQIRGSGVLGDMCHTTEDAISSCFDLIGIEVQRVLLWLMVGIALLGNLVVILYRLIWERIVLEKAYGLFVLNLSISDLIMGIYLLIIAIADVYYRGVYVMYDNDWKESILCRIAGFLATLSSETSAFFIFLVTVDRFLVLKFPFGQKQFSTMTKTIATTLAWSVSFVLALVQVLPIFGFHSVSTYSAMCIGLPLTNQRVNGWGYSLSIFIVLNFIMFLFTAIGQVLIFSSISENRMSVEAVNQNSLRRAQDITVAKQLSMVILSNFICWFPVGLMVFLALSGHQISNGVYAWTVVFVLPVNSAIDPILYTIPCILTKWNKFKYGNLKPH